MTKTGANADTSGASSFQVALAYGPSLAEESDRVGVPERLLRLATGDNFGESGLLTGEPLVGQVTALTRVVIYEISKDALSPLLKARPAIAEELSDTLQ
jgi:CRP-like cAMP-binding protein